LPSGGGGDREQQALYAESGHSPFWGALRSGYFVVSSFIVLAAGHILARKLSLKKRF